MPLQKKEALFPVPSQKTIREDFAKLQRAAAEALVSRRTLTSASLSFAYFLDNFDVVKMLADNSIYFAYLYYRTESYLWQTSRFDSSKLTDTMYPQIKFQTVIYNVFIKWTDELVTLPNATNLYYEQIYTLISAELNASKNLQPLPWRDTFDRFTDIEPVASLNSLTEFCTAHLRTAAVPAMTFFNINALAEQIVEFNSSARLPRWRPLTGDDCSFLPGVFIESGENPAVFASHRKLPKNNFLIYYYYILIAEYRFDHHCLWRNPKTHDFLSAELPHFNKLYEALKTIKPFIQRTNLSIFLKALLKPALAKKYFAKNIILDSWTQFEHRETYEFSCRQLDVIKKLAAYHFTVYPVPLVREVVYALVQLHYALTHFLRVNKALARGIRLPAKDLTRELTQELTIANSAPSGSRASHASASGSVSSRSRVARENSFALTAADEFLLTLSPFIEKAIISAIHQYIQTLVDANNPAVLNADKPDIINAVVERVANQIGVLDGIDPNLTSYTIANNALEWLLIANLQSVRSSADQFKQLEKPRQLQIIFQRIAQSAYSQDLDSIKELVAQMLIKLREDQLVIDSEDTPLALILLLQQCRGLDELHRLKNSQMICFEKASKNAAEYAGENGLIAPHLGRLKQIQLALGNWLAQSNPLTPEQCEALYATHIYATKIDEIYRHILVWLVHPTQNGEQFKNLVLEKTTFKRLKNITAVLEKFNWVNVDNALFVGLKATYHSFFRDSFVILTEDYRDKIDKSLAINLARNLRVSLNIEQHPAYRSLYDSILKAAELKAGEIK
jgi:hypothetical protein